MMRNRVLITLLAIAALSALASYAVAQQSSRADRPPDDPSKAESDDARANFSVFARGQRASEVTDRDKETLPPSIRLDPANTRLARQDSKGNKIYVLASQSDLCLRLEQANGTGSMSCHAASAETGSGHEPPISVDLVEPDTYRVTALVPDGMRSVAVQLSDGSTRQLSIDNNVATAVVTGHPRAITWIAPDGTNGDLNF